LWEERIKWAIFVHMMCLDPRAHLFVPYLVKLTIITIIKLCCVWFLFSLNSSKAIWQMPLFFSFLLFYFYFILWAAVLKRNVFYDFTLWYVYINEYMDWIVRRKQRDLMDNKHSRRKSLKKHFSYFTTSASLSLHKFNKNLNIWWSTSRIPNKKK
jgi:hypothetical protein